MKNNRFGWAIVIAMVLVVAVWNLGYDMHMLPDIVKAEPMASGWWCYRGRALPYPHSTRYGGANEAPCSQYDVDFFVHGASPSPSFVAPENFTRNTRDRPTGRTRVQDSASCDC
jgi:hypothetical protein